MKLHAPFSLKDRACARSWLGQRAGECCAKTTREPGKEPKINQVSGKKLSHSAGRAGAGRITGREGGHHPKRLLQQFPVEGMPAAGNLYVGGGACINHHAQWSRNCNK